MRPTVVLRFALMLAGITLFGLGIRDENDFLRWSGIAVIALAVAIRIALRLRAGRMR